MSSDVLLPQGLPPEAIPAGTTAVFTTASHQSPTGSAMPIERRRAFLQSATERGAKP